MNLGTKNKIKILAQQFDLKYNPKIFKVVYLSKKELVLINFLTGCPEPEYLKFGKKVNQRIKNIENFINSKEFKMKIKKQGGCVTSKKYFEKSVKKIQNKKIRNEYIKIIKKFKYDISNMGSVILSKPENKKESEFSKKILFHEWIHALLIYNKIHFQNIKWKYWKLDEGLTTYIEYFLKPYIEKILKTKSKNKFFQIYVKNALKWHKILKDKKTSKERRKTILDYYKKLKKVKK